MLFKGKVENIMNINKLNKDIDSFAYWNVPRVDLSSCLADERESAFRRAYCPGFPSGYRQQLLNTSGVGYVFVGKNRGNRGNAEELANFHGSIQSADYRLAAAAYGTATWGAFMTDISDEVNSNSREVKLRTENVETLMKHLKDVGIPNTVTLIAIGKDVYTILEANKGLITGKIVRIPHYSRINIGKYPHWDAYKVHELLQKMP
uniref:hypothetical protein n=1 Tax=Lacticaseibacillus paracasei TaxID=1597 RepID=UPI00351EAF8E